MNHIPSTRLKVPHGKWLMVNLMFSKHLQQHIIKSKATFPVTVVLALLIWTVGVQWPLDSDTHIASWWWEGIYCPVWTIELTNLICCGYTVFLLANLNEIYSLSGNCIYKGNANEAPQLSKGTYVIRQSGKTRKVLVN